LGNEQVLRRAYQIAGDKDLEGWVAAFTDYGTFTDESIGVTHRGPDRLPEQVQNYALAFPDPLGQGRDAPQRSASRRDPGQERAMAVAARAVIGGKATSTHQAPRRREGRCKPNRQPRPAPAHRPA